MEEPVKRKNGRTGEREGFKNQQKRMEDIAKNAEMRITMSKKKGVMLLLDVIMTAMLLAFDQYTKFLAVTHLKDRPAVPLLKGILEFQYLENRGTAFGLLKDQKVFILFVGVVFLFFILFFLLKMPIHKKYVIVHCLLSVIMAGGIGNMADRVRLDYVIDFIYFVPIDFPIFNMADSYVVVATIGLFIVFTFIFKEKDLEFLNFKQNKYREMK